MFDEVLMYIEYDNELSSYFNAMGYAVHEKSRALIAQFKLPSETVQHIGHEHIDIDSEQIISHIVTERLQGVYAILERQHLLDVITVDNIYRGEGVVLSILSTVANKELNDVQDDKYTTVSFVACAVWSMFALAMIAYALLAQFA